MSEPSNLDIAKELAAQYAPDLLPERAPITTEIKETDPLDGIEWDPRPVLLPGLDYRDHTVYMTFPLQFKRMKKFGKGKEAYELPQNVYETRCVTSAGDIFAFDPKTLHARGFSFPLTFMQLQEPSRWSENDLRTYIEGRAEEPDPFELYKDIRKIYETYIEFGEERHYDLMTLYIMLSYVFRLFTSLCYIHFNGTAAAGKSQNLGILKALAFNAVWTGSITPSSMFRTIASNPGTVLIDEAEDWKSESQMILLNILKSGYSTGSDTTRSEKNSQDNYIPTKFPVFGPKVISSINPLDYVLQSRCIIVNMRPAIRKIPAFNRDINAWTDMRNRLYLWGLYHAPQIELKAKEWNATKRYEKAGSLQNRNWEIAHSLLTLADYIGGDTLTDPMIEWLSDYWKKAIKNANVTDKLAILLQALPRVMDLATFEDDHYYSIKRIHEIVLGYLLEDERENYKTRTALRHLQTLGFTERRTSRTGTEVQVHEKDVRKALTQRKIDPFEEDTDWYQEKKSYQEDKRSVELQNLWSVREEADDTAWPKTGT